MSTVRVTLEDDQLEVEVIVEHPVRERALRAAHGILGFMLRSERTPVTLHTAKPEEGR